MRMFLNAVNTGDLTGDWLASHKHSDFGFLNVMRTFTYIKHSTFNN